MRRVTLEGLWDFRTDPDRAGESLGYAGCSRFEECQMRVPGSWRLAEPYRHYHGVAWYKRFFDLDPADATQQVGIWFGGAFRHADIYVNGRFIQKHKGFQSGFAIDITDAVHAGENWLAVRIDDTQEPETDIMGGASIMDQTEVVYLAGMYEPVWLEIRAAVHVTDVYAPLDRRAAVVRLNLTLVNKTGGPVDTDVEIKITSVSDVVVAAQKTVTLQQCSASCSYSFEFPMAAFQLWSPEQPVLYDLTITARAGDATDHYCQRTGFKSFEADGSQFCLNGQPYFLRGYGDDFVFPLTSLPDATNSDFYKPLLRKARAYGFNAARHHSHFPFEAYLAAADEIGMLVQPELALANIPLLRFTENNQALFLGQWRELLLENRHHPCIMAWCGGNEQEWGYPFEQELYDTAKTLDPFRLVMATDGNFMANEIGVVHDYASIVYAEYTDVLPVDTFADLYLRDRSGKPQIVHEMGNYCTLPDITELPAYDQAVVKPESLRCYAAMVRQRALEPLYWRCFAQAQTLYRLCHKLNIEAARRSPYVSGYHIWTFNDYYGTTQGIVSALYRDKAFTAEQFARLNAPSLLLWDTPRAVFGAGETIRFTLLISKYHPEDWPDAQLSLTLSDGQTVQTQCSLSGSGVLPLAEWPLTLPDDPTARQLVLQAELTAGNVRLTNEWPLWVYPDCPIQNDKELFINYLSRYLVESCRFRIRHFTIPMPFDERQLILTGFIYDGMLEAVEQGASMLLLAGPRTFRHTVCGNAFKSPWWMAKPFFYLNRTNNSQAAHVIEDHPALAGVPHETCWNLNFYRLVENRHAVHIDAYELPCDPILYGVDADLNRMAYLFEFTLGKGRVLVSTLNFDRENLVSVEVQYTFNSLLNYCQSAKFRPKTTLSRDDLKNALAPGDWQS